MLVWESADVSTNKLNTHIVIVDNVAKVGNQGSADSVALAKILLRNLNLPTHLLRTAFFMPTGNVKAGKFPKIKILLSNGDVAYEFRSRMFVGRKGA